MNIVFIAAEVIPFAKTGGLADVCGTLPIQLEELGHEVAIIMPHYRCVGAKEAFSERADVDTIGQNIRVYFIKNKKFFDRPYIYGENGGDYPDSAERFGFFCQEAMKLLKDIGRPVDIIHCHDWQTGLVPVLLRENYAGDPFFASTRSVFTIHNLAYQGVFPREDFPVLGVEDRLFNEHQMEFYGKINFMKSGIIFSDYVTTVSPQYAREIQTKDWGCGLEGVLQARKGRFMGILNGLDYKLWDPENDVLIDPKYSAKEWLAKKIHKDQLRSVFKLPVYADIPIFGFVGRLFAQKGFDLIESAMEGLMQRPLQMVFLGVGEEKYEKLLKKLARKYPQKCSVLIRYDEDIAHQVYAGSDFFLMPSVYEPCGLTQMIALRYGTIPVVSAVGGLLDTVTDFSSSKKKGDGFLLSSYSVSGLLEAVDRASGIYSQKEKYADLIRHAMACRWTWETSAKHYIEVYQACSS